MNDNKQAIKDSIHLPKTDFPMKANLSQRETEIIKIWKENHIYRKMVDKNKACSPFTMLDGPPYANGHIHIGHSLNKCLKDFVIKYKNMAGFYAPYIPGWDCHGLPIEHKVTKELGSGAKDKSSRELRQMCRKEAGKWVNIQREEFIRLGVFGQWENPYLTMNSGYEAEEVREFARHYKNGVIVRGEKPVYWCVPLQTALAEAEIEYLDHRSPSIYVRFPYKPHSRFGTFNKAVHCVIWTTTPWTLPSNQAIALNENHEYGFFESGDECLLLARKVREKFEKETGLKLKEPGKYFFGKEFEFEKAWHPLADRPSLLILGDHVTLETGSGLVHTAPGHGQDDYLVGCQYHLPIMSPVTPDGRFTHEVPKYLGLDIFEANPMIIDDLKKSGHLLAHRDIVHSYPHCWRTKTPLIFRTTAQWFMKMDDGKYNIRQKALKAINDIQFVPDWGVKRLKAMIENRPDWCISRQRNWGVPIPVLYCKACDTPWLDEEVMEKIASAMEKGSGIEAYYDLPVEELVLDHVCKNCGAGDFKKGSDILDVWFDSGVCHGAVQRKREELNFPADLYLEGSDQHRGWFQTSLLTSIASSGQSPFKALLTHNFVNDSKGRKMSKSLGNVVDPADLIKRSGAELLRLWTASQDYGQDMNYSQEGFQRVTETYRRLRNILRFLLGNLHDFDFKKDKISCGQMPPLDQWILDRFCQFMEKVTEHYDRFEFCKVYHCLNQFFTIDLSNHYLDMVKDRLYTWKSDGYPRRSCQTVIYLLAENLIKVMAPILSFLSEEAYSHFPGKTRNSVFMEDFPKADPSWKNEQIRSLFVTLFEVRSLVSKKLEEQRAAKNMGSSLEAGVRLELSEETVKVFEKLSKGQLREFFIVSELTLGDKPPLSPTSQKENNTENPDRFDINIQVQKASGEKCPRCWNYDTLVETRVYGRVCEKCNEALK